MQFVNESNVCKCQGRCLHEFEKRLEKYEKKGKVPKKELNCQDGFVFYDNSADCMVYMCGKVRHSLVDHTKLKMEDKECLEDYGLIEYLGETKWARVENKKGACGWTEVVPAVTNKVVVARTTVRRNGKVKFRVSVHPSLGKNLTLEQRRVIGRANEKKTKVAREVIQQMKTNEHLEKQRQWLKESSYR